MKHISKKLNKPLAPLTRQIVYAFLIGLIVGGIAIGLVDSYAKQPLFSSADFPGGGIRGGVGGSPGVTGGIGGSVGGTGVSGCIGGSVGGTGVTGGIGGSVGGGSVGSGIGGRVGENENCVGGVGGSVGTGSGTGTGTGSGPGGTSGGVTGVVNDPSDDDTADASAGGDVNSAVGVTGRDYDQVLGRFSNPLEFETIPELIIRLINIILLFAGMLAVGTIIWGGFLMVTSAGSETRLTKGKNAVIWSLGGLIVCIMSFSIVAIIERIIAR